MGVRNLLLGLLCLAAVAGCGSARTVNIEPERVTANGFELDILPETIKPGQSAGGFEVVTRQEGASLVADIAVSDAVNLTGLYFDLRYDAQRMHPVGVAATATLGATGELLTVGVIDSPGTVSHGQALIGEPGTRGFSGSGVLATVRFEPGAARAVAAAPSSDDSRGQMSWNPLSRELSWRYYNSGDYDQNGEVNAADLAPLAKYFRHAGPFEANSVQEVVDGDSNGEINGADIVKIASNFQARAQGYRIYKSTNADDVPTVNDAPSSIPPVAEITFDSAQGDRTSERLYFNYTMGETEAGDYFWARPFDGNTEGTACATAGGDSELTLTLLNPPTSGDGTEASPFIMVSEQLYEFQLVHSTVGDVSTALLTEYFLDPATAGTLTNADATLTIDEAFVGDFSVAATYLGQPSEPQFIYCRVEPEVAENQPPVITNFTITPDIGDAPLVTEQLAIVTDDGVGGTSLTFEWDWNSDGTYDENSGTGNLAFHTYDVPGTFETTVRVTDAGGLSATATASVVVNEQGGDNEWPVSIIEASRRNGPPPLQVEFDGSWSYDLDGNIVLFEWDFESDGTFDQSGPESFASHTYTELGVFEASLRVTDDQGATDQNSISIRVVDTGWKTTIVSSGDDVYGGWPALVDAGGLPGVAYFLGDDWNGIYEVQYRRALDAAGDSWSAPLTISQANVYPHAVADAILVDGNPAALFQGNGDFESGLFYVRANDSLGSTWSTPQKIDNGAYNGYSQMQIVQGNPAVVYVNEYMSEDDYWSKLAYIRAGDAQGNNWGSPQYFDATDGFTGVVPSFDLIGGKPAILYFDPNGSMMRLARGADALGSAWENPIDLLNEENGGYNPNLYGGSKQPMVIFHDLLARLNFMPATDMEASGFEEPQILDERVTNYADDYGPRMAWVTNAASEEVPAIAYFRDGEEGQDLIPTEVIYLEAANPQGTEWLEPEVVYIGEWGCLQIDLLAIDGEPHIVFSDSYSYQVVHAQRN